MNHGQASQQVGDYYVPSQLKSTHNQPNKELGQPATPKEEKDRPFIKNQETFIYETLNGY